MDGAGPAVVGDYQLEQIVARSPASEVWRAHRIDGCGGAVAVKRARRGPSALGRLRAEAEILADLALPNVVRILEVVADGDDVAIVMELAAGGSLEDLLADRGHLPAGEVVAIVAPLALALGAAHRRGVVHGDVKPANVLLDAAGVPLLADFGAARTTGPVGGDLHGSAAFVDPQLLATGRADASNDVYALGAVTYLALTGRPPHEGATDREVFDAAARGAHPPLTDRAGVPPLLAAAVEAALARDVSRRPPSAEYFAATVRAAVDPATVVLPAGRATAGTAPAPVAVATRSFGPQPVRPLPDPVGTGRRLARTGALVGAGVLVLAGVVGVAAVRDRGGVTDGTSVAAGLNDPGAGACPELEPIPVPPTGRELLADLAGDGCPEQIVWDGSVMQFRLDDADLVPRRYDFTEHGSRPRSGDLLVGDWDCDGTDSPAFYDPATGQVHYFAAVPRSGGLSAASLDETGIEGGAVRVVRGRDGVCDRVAVRP